MAYLLSAVRTPCSAVVPIASTAWDMESMALAFAPASAPPWLNWKDPISSAAPQVACLLLTPWHSTFPEPTPSPAKPSPRPQQFRLARLQSYSSPSALVLWRVLQTLAMHN